MPSSRDGWGKTDATLARGRGGVNRNFHYYTGFREGQDIVPEAQEQSMPYQTLLKSVIRQYLAGKLVPRP